MSEWTSWPPFEAGNSIVYTITKQRKWWQFWKPREWQETGFYHIVGYVRFPISTFDRYISGPPPAADEPTAE